MIIYENSAYADNQYIGMLTKQISRNCNIKCV